MSALPPIYFERLLEDSPDIIVAVDKHGAIVFFNDGARTALGYLPEEVLGKHVRMFYPTDEDARAVMQAMRDDKVDSPGKVRSFKTTFVTKSGERLNVAISGALIHDEQGNQIGSIGFAKDLAEIQRQDQLTTIGEIAVGVGSGGRKAAGIELEVSSDYLLGKDPSAVYETCVMSKAGEPPSRPLYMRPDWRG